MKLTIIRLDKFSPQDKTDLDKIWPQGNAAQLAMDDSHRLYAARFNDRLLAAVRVRLQGTQGELEDLQVREVTRRRGVGRYLLEEVMRDNPTVTSWRIADRGVADRGVMAAFMQALGFRAQADGWQKTL